MNEACTQANTGHLDVAPQVAQLEKRSGLEGAATVSGLAAQGVALSCDDLAHQLGIDASLPELAAGLPRLPQNYVDELRDLEELDQCLKEGVALHACTYSYRSVSRALPQNVDPNAEFEMLWRALEKMDRMASFTQRAIQLMVRHVASLVEPVRADLVVSEQLLERLQALLDSLVVLNALKDMKTSMKNDFARFKRASSSAHFAQVLQQQQKSAAEVDAKRDTLQHFMQNQAHMTNFVMFSLKQEITRIDGFELVIAALAKDALRRLAWNDELRTAVLAHCDGDGGVTDDDVVTLGGGFLLPGDEFRLLRILPYCLFLADTGDATVFSSKQSMPLLKMQKLCKQRPLLPLFAEMVLEVQFVLPLCPSWREEFAAQWLPSASSSWLGGGAWSDVKQDYALRSHTAEMRRRYLDFTVVFTETANALRRHGQLSQEPPPAAVCRRAYSVVLTALSLLSAWKAATCLSVAWHMTHPVDEEALARLRTESTQELDEHTRRSEAYDKVVRYNFDDTHLYAIVDAVGMIKGLAALVSSAQSLLSPLLRRVAYDEVQQLAQAGLARPLRRTHKRGKKRLEAFEALEAVRFMLADWLGEDRTMDYQKKAKELAAIRRVYRERFVAPTELQVALMRRLIHSVFDSRSVGMRQGGGFIGLGVKNDLTPESVQHLSRVYRTSRVWQSLLGDAVLEDGSTGHSPLFDLGGTLRSLSDFAFLWLREFHLELTGCSQFEIDQSLPWLLTDFVLRTPSLQANALLVLECYDDAGTRALKHFAQQFLFDELQAELDLAFDQFVYLVSERIFAHCKTLAAQRQLPDELVESWRQKERLRVRLQSKRHKKLLRQYLEHREGEAPAPPRSARMLEIASARYGTLMSQRHVRLLGRAVDLHGLIAERLNAHFREALDLALRRFESKALSNGVVELSLLVENCRLAHDILCTQFGMEGLDAFDEVLAEVDGDVRCTAAVGGARRGRTIIHIFGELANDTLLRSTFNTSTRRFVSVAERDRIQSDDDADGARVRRNAPPSHSPPSLLFGASDWNAVFASFLRQFAQWLGAPHFEAMWSLLSPGDIALLADELCASAAQLLQDGVRPYVQVLQQGLPPQLRLSELSPASVVSVYGKLTIQLSDIAKYPELRCGALKALREFGNHVAAVYMLDVCRRSAEASDGVALPLALLSAGARVGPEAAVRDAALLGDVPRPVDAEEQEAADADAVLAWPMPSALVPLAAEEEEDRFDVVVSQLEAAVGHDVRPAPVRAQVESQPSFLAAMLRRVDHVMREAAPAAEGTTSSSQSMRALWRTSAQVAKSEDPTPSPVEVEDPRDFARLWSVLCFVLCEASPHELAADAAAIAGDRGKRTAVFGALALRGSDADFAGGDLSRFADSVLWAGVSLLQATQLQARHAMLDLGRHLLALHDMQPIDWRAAVTARLEQNAAAAAGKPWNKTPEDYGCSLQPVELALLPSLRRQLLAQRWLLQRQMLVQRLLQSFALPLQAEDTDLVTVFGPVRPDSLDAVPGVEVLRVHSAGTPPSQQQAEALWTRDEFDCAAWLIDA